MWFRVCTDALGSRCAFLETPQIFSPEKPFVNVWTTHSTNVLFWQELFNLEQSFMLRSFFVFKAQCELLCPKSARKVSELSRNALHAWSLTVWKLTITLVNPAIPLTNRYTNWWRHLGTTYFTAVKRKKLRHIRSFRALKCESVRKFTSAKLVWKGCRTCSGKPNFTLAKLVHASYFISNTYST